MTDTIVTPPVYILGSPLPKAEYALFDWDNQQMSLAQAADCGSQMVAIGTGPGAVPTGTGCQESAALPSVRSCVGPVMAVAQCEHTGFDLISLLKEIALEEFRQSLSPEAALENSLGRETLSTVPPYWLHEKTSLGSTA